MPATTRVNSSPVPQNRPGRGALVGQQGIGVGRDRRARPTAAPARHRVERHRHEQGQQAGARRRTARQRVDADEHGEEQRARHHHVGVHEQVHGVVAHGQPEQRREVDRHQPAAEQRPGHDRVGDDVRRPAAERGPQGLAGRRVPPPAAPGSAAPTAPAAAARPCPAARAAPCAPTSGRPRTGRCPTGWRPRATTSAPAIAALRAGDHARPRAARRRTPTAYRPPVSPTSSSDAGSSCQPTTRSRTLGSATAAEGTPGGFRPPVRRVPGPASRPVATIARALSVLALLQRRACR